MNDELFKTPSRSMGQNILPLLVYSWQETRPRTHVFSQGALKWVGLIAKYLSFFTAEGPSFELVSNTLPK